MTTPVALEMAALRSTCVPAERLLAVVGELSLASGAPGLVGGQVVDLECEGKSVVLDTLWRYRSSTKSSISPPAAKCLAKLFFKAP